MAMFWVVLGGIIAIWSATFPFGRRETPGPAFFPLGCGLIFLLLGIIMFLQGKTRKGESLLRPSKPVFPPWPVARRVGLALGGMAVSAALLDTLGFVLTMFLMVLFLIQAIEPRKWKVAVFYSLSFALGSLFLFRVLLKTSLPLGYLGF